MNKQSHDHQNESDNDEGFIPSKIIIKQKNALTLKKQSLSRSNRKEFIPRYISEGIMRKQPAQCYSRFSKFDLVEQSKNSTNAQQNLDNSLWQAERQLQSNNTKEIFMAQKNKIKQKISTPYDKYVSSGDYYLVYSRYKDFEFSNENVNFANNQVKLDCLRSLEQMKFKPIKPFQIIEQKRQQVLTQKLNRNGTIRQSLLKFDSKFQCGNLLCAFKHKNQPYVYTLFIQNDTNTYGYNQWFYFSIKNAQTGIKYKLNIVNFRKRNSFFREGNRPVIFSLINSKKEGISGYSKRGENITYGKSSIVKSYDSKEKFFQLSFQLQFQNNDDLIYISAGLPYSYSKLLNNLSLYEQKSKQNGINFEMESIGTSVAGNSIPYVTITKIDNQRSGFNQIKVSNSYRQRSQELNIEDQVYEQTQKNHHNHTQSSMQGSAKKVILLIARQHPGQTWSSYLMDQFINSLVNQTSLQSEYILNNFIVKCIPMINVDGVITGNFRCDLTGMDLNRNWKTPSALLHPQIYSIKNQIISLTNRGYKVETCLDLHGHSKEYNVFCYSCKTDNYQCRLLPYIFSDINQQFQFPLCTFGISKYKQSTARAVIFNIIKNTNVLTVQSSFFGSKINGQIQIFQPHNFQKMAETLIKGFKSYFSHDQSYQSCKQMVRLKMTQFLQYKGQNDNALSGSDSQPSGDEIQFVQKFQNIIPKNLMEECIEMENMKKPVKRKRNLKRQTFQVPNQKGNYQIKKISFNSQGKNRTIDVVKEESISKQTKSNWQTIKKRKPQDDYNRTSHFKKKSIIISNQMLDQNEMKGNKKIFLKDLIDRQEHKLPFFSRQKSTMVPLKLKNQSFQIFKDAYNATQKQIKHHNETSLDDMRNSRRNLSKKLAIYKQKNDKQTDQFPLLCVLSENKKRTHVQKIKLRRQVNNQDRGRQQSSPQKVKTAIQTRTDAIRHLRQKNKNSMQLVSKIWRQNFTRYGMAFSTFKISK